MAADLTTTDTGSPRQTAYLDVARLENGRYCVRFVKDGLVPRTSYTNHSDAVVRQAQRAGNIPVRTVDAELRHLCRDHLLELIER
jgi:hypothetical protein